MGLPSPKKAGQLSTRPATLYMGHRGRESALRVRTAVAGDCDQVVAVVDDWWGRPVSSSLPRLFFDHFSPTSSIAEDDLVPCQSTFAL